MEYGFGNWRVEVAHFTTDKPYTEKEADKPLWIAFAITGVLALCVMNQ